MCPRPRAAAASSTSTATTVEAVAGEHLDDAGAHRAETDHADPCELACHVPCPFVDSPGPHRPGVGRSCHVRPTRPHPSSGAVTHALGAALPVPSVDQAGQHRHGLHDPAGPVERHDVDALEAALGDRERAGELPQAVAAVDAPEAGVADAAEGQRRAWPRTR